uniref:Uncharacterized protein n=1 Tax=Pyramimonas orientalis virus TaxID=455367 RepID=A0A7M3UNW7_POV01|nr:hypothetical protein HWQ62_00271 [Pyramimonas orientalis virus]
MDKHIAFYNKSLNKINKELRTNIIDSKSRFYHPSLTEKLQLHMDVLLTNTKLYPFKRLYDLPWKIKFFKTKYNIEKNYPHTHHGTIFFPSNYFSFDKNERISLLIHEKIHIYQRFFPIPYHKILFDKYNLRVQALVSSHADFNNIRQNPDNNLLIYSDNGQYTLPIFKKKPLSIKDVVFVDYNEHNTQTVYSKLSKNEHPNETFAYHITKSILDGTIHQSFIKYL